MKEALKLALEALEEPLAPTKRLKAITAIKEALREHAMYEVQRLGQEIQPEQEPVAWMREDEMKAMTSLEKDAWIKSGRIDLVKDYNKALSHKLKPLSEEKISKLAVCGVFKGDAKTITRALEATHGIKEKNT